MMATRFIEKITDACKAAGLPKPIIEENSGGIAIELVKMPVSEKAVSDETSGKRRESVGKTSGKRRV